MSAAPDDDAAALAERLRRAVGTFVRAIRRAPEAARTARTETLDLIDREGALNVATLAQARGVTHQTMRLVVAQLLADGLARAEPDPADRRSRLLTLTPAGREDVARGREARAARIEATIRATLSPREREALRAGVALIERMSASVSRP